MKYVQINSTETISVTPGLQRLNVTNENSDVPNRLKVSPLWAKATVLIKKGIHEYPAEIASWNTVKALERDGILTIGKQTDVTDDEEAIKDAKMLEKSADILKTKKVTKTKIDAKKKVVVSESLDDIVSDEEE